MVKKLKWLVILIDCLIGALILSGLFVLFEDALGKPSSFERSLVLGVLVGFLNAYSGFWADELSKPRFYCDREIVPWGPITTIVFCAFMINSLAYIGVTAGLSSMESVLVGMLGLFAIVKLRNGALLKLRGHYGH